MNRVIREQTSKPKKPRKKPLKTLNLALKAMRGLGYLGDSVERSLGFGKFAVKKDWAGFADILVFKPGKPGMVAIQACSWSSDMNAHLRKVLALTNAYDFVRTPYNRILVIAWKKKPRKSAAKWVEEVTESHYNDLLAQKTIQFAECTVEPSSVLAELFYVRRAMQKEARERLSTKGSA